MTAMGRNGLPIIVYGVMTNGERGCPRGGERLCREHGRCDDGSRTKSRSCVERFGLARVVLVGDRGMLTQPQIDKAQNSILVWGWITALTSTAIQELGEAGGLAMACHSWTRRIWPKSRQRIIPASG